MQNIIFVYAKLNLFKNQRNPELKIYIVNNLVKNLISKN